MRHGVAGLLERTTVGLALVAEQVEFSGDEEGVRLAGEVIGHERGDARVLARLRVRDIHLEVVLDLVGGEAVVLPVVAHGGER